MSDTFLYDSLPYVVLVLAVGVPAWLRYRERVSAWVMRWVAREGTGSAAVSLVVGALIMLLWHAACFLLPHAVQLFIRSPVRLFFLEAVGLIGGMMLAWGLAASISRRLSSREPGTRAWLPFQVLLLAEVLNGLYIAVAYRWASAWYVSVVVPYLRSLVTLQPDATLVAQLPLTVRMHLFGVLALLLAWPITRWLASAAPTPTLVSSREESASQGGIVTP
ncbi:respiratory nitrate reductase subunit gamma [Vitiosangium sp. GDMCC 1.1324]|uniref:respiratory nitrate reductase subunit gamma n=1 Tax=Vitiosangium sp. (strain GDMCC 1.1324) TaxID=2138576 RepID=UPI00130D953D|nr:respiratory nitrate reductase subunit gamma [Vitiosangium sp. GDMCC 1.1324]